MTLENLVSRIDALEEQIRSHNNSLISASSKLNEVDERANNFLNIVRDQKREFARLNSTIMRLGKFDGTINQVRADFNRKLDEIQTQSKQQGQSRANLITEDFKSVQIQIEKLKNEITNDNEKRLALYIEEHSRMVNRFKEIEEKNKENIIYSEESKTLISTIQQDHRRTMKQVEGLQSDQDIYRNTQGEVRSKLETITDSLRTNDSRLNELVVMESERRQNQLEFMEKQTVFQNDKERTWIDWKQQFDLSIKQVNELLPSLQQQQFTLKQTKEDLDEVSQQFERRIKEITEIYRLMDEKFRKEWDTFKSDAEKRWSNISLVLDDKQGGYAEKIQALKERMVLVEDNNHEMQEVFLLMSSEIQKGMQNIMKMVNGWMDAFGHIKTLK